MNDKVKYTGPLCSYRKVRVQAAGTKKQIDGVRHALDKARAGIVSALIDVSRLTGKGVPVDGVAQCFKSVLATDYRANFVPDAEIARVMERAGVRLVCSMSPLSGKPLARALSSGEHPVEYENSKYGRLNYLTGNGWCAVEGLIPDNYELTEVREYLMSAVQGMDARFFLDGKAYRQLAA